MSKYLDLARGVLGPKDTMRGKSGISGITSPGAPANTRDVVLACRALGVRLRVTKDDDLRCEPASLLTPALREAIRVSRGELIFDLLLADALRYVAVEHYAEGADVGSVLDAHGDAIDAAYLARDWAAFRAAIRAFAAAGRREAERARGLALSSVSSSTPSLVKGAANS